MLLTALLLGCTPPPTQALRFDGEAPHNLVLYVVDTLRRDRVTAYGKVAATPGLAEHAANSVVVDDLQASGTWTGTATASLLTSVAPQDHGLVHTHDVGSDMLASTPTWAERLTAAGWDTGQFSANDHATLHGLDRGFATSETTSDVRATTLVADALQWVDGASAPFFVHLQPRDPHAAYAPPDELRGVFEDDADFPTGARAQERWIEGQADRAPAEQVAGLATIRGLYSEDVLESDRGFSALLDGLAARDLLDDTLVVFTSDHGEALAEHDDYFGHGLYRTEVSTVPLVFVHPRLLADAFVGPWSQLDVMPTALGALATPVVATDVAGLDRAAVGREIAVTVSLGESTDTAPERRAIAGTDGRARVVWQCDGTVVAYDREADPAEDRALDVDEVRGGAALREAMAAEVEAACAMP